MGKKHKKKFEAIKIDGSGESAVHDWIVAEEALQININGKPYTVTMRTPGSDEYLVRGLLFTENIYDQKDQLTIKVLDSPDDETSTTIGVWIEPQNLREGYYQSRSLLSVSSCGICGKRELSDLEIDGSALICDEILDTGLIAPMFDRMKEAQANFAATGGAHAAACFTIDGALLAIQEDIGRHNAVDKVIGELLKTGKFEKSRCMLVSGRISFEIVSKCYKAGIPYLAAVSSPSSLSIECARNFGITLIAFCRGEAFTCYAHENRLERKKEIAINP